MPSTTPKGYRQPVDTDPVGDGALAVRNLAADIDAAHDSQVATCTGTTVTGATVDLGGVTTTVAVPSTSAVYLVTVSADVTHNDANTGVLIIELVVDGAVQSIQLLMGSSVNGLRAGISRTWRVTGITAGSRVFKATGRISGTSSYTVNTHTQIVVARQA